MSIRRMGSPAIVAVLIFLGLGLFPRPARAGCPPNSWEVSRSETADQIRIKCHCNVGYKHRGGQCRRYKSGKCADSTKVYYRGACVAPENAPLGKQGFGIITGDAFTAGIFMRTYAIEQNWPRAARNRWFASTLLAAHGYYARAKRLLAAKRGFTADDAWRKWAKRFDRDLNNFIAAQNEFEKKFGPLARKTFDPASVKDLKIDAVRKLVLASIARGQKNYERSIKLYNDALSSASRSGSPLLRKEINQATVMTRQLKASRDKHLNQGAKEAYYKKRRDERAAETAWWLGVHLAESGKGKQAIGYLREAQHYYNGAGGRDPTMKHIIEKDIKELTANPRSGIFKTQPTKGRLLTHYTNAKKIDIVFDALEYGKGDWNLSIRYLRSASQADPKNVKITRALEYVKGLSASR